MLAIYRRALRGPDMKLAQEVSSYSLSNDDAITRITFAGNPHYIELHADAAGREELALIAAKASTNIPGEAYTQEREEHPKRAAAWLRQLADKLESK